MSFFREELQIFFLLSPYEMVELSIYSVHTLKWNKTFYSHDGQIMRRWAPGHRYTKGPTTSPPQEQNTDFVVALPNFLLLFCISLWSFLVSLRLFWVSLWLVRVDLSYILQVKARGAPDILGLRVCAWKAHLVIHPWFTHLFLSAMFKTHFTYNINIYLLIQKRSTWKRQ